MNTPGSKSSVYGTNAPAILAQGYENYVSSTVTNDVNGWWYSFTVTVSNFDDSGHAFVRVGDQAVVLARPAASLMFLAAAAAAAPVSASATFLLEQGRHYDLYVSPADNTAYAASEPSAVIVPPTAAGAGSVTVAPTGLSIDPSTWHSSVSGGLQSFSAVCRHAHPGLGAWSWTCADPSVHIDTPSNSAVVIRWDWADVSWRATNVVVTCALDDWTFTTNLWISCGTNDAPQVHLVDSVPSGVLLNDDDDDGNGTIDLQETAVSGAENDLVSITVGFTSDIPTNGTVRISVTQGADRIRIWRNADKSGGQVTLPWSATVDEPADSASWTFYIEGVAKSEAVDDVRFCMSWNNGNATLVNELSLTVLDIRLEPITTECYTATNYNPSGILKGGRARIKAEVLPTTFPEERIHWSCASGSATFIGNAYGRIIEVTCSDDATTDLVLEMDIPGCACNCPRITLRPVTLSVVKLYPVIINAADKTTTTPTAVIADIERVNNIFAQVGIRFELGAPVREIVDGNLVNLPTPELYKRKRASIRSLQSGLDGLAIYYIARLFHENTTDREEGSEALGIYETGTIIVSVLTPVAKNLAHELGHACGWADIYDNYVSDVDVDTGKDVVSDVSGVPSQDRMPSDWNGGTGSRYYRPGISQKNIIDRLLMYGNYNDTATDIPLGAVYGHWYHWVGNAKIENTGLVPVGLSDMNRSPGTTAQEGNP